MSDARWSGPREYDARDRGDEWPRVYDPRDRDEHDPRDVLMRDLDLPRGDERELVVDRDRVYELDGEDSRTLAVVGAFRSQTSNQQLCLGIKPLNRGIDTCSNSSSV